jgi:hypothetical protein
MTAEEYFIDWDLEHDYESGDVISIMKDYAKIKCQELLTIVAEKSKVIESTPYINYKPESMIKRGSNIISVYKDSILSAVDLNQFIN